MCNIGPWPAVNSIRLHCPAEVVYIIGKIAKEAGIWPSLFDARLTARATEVIAQLASLPHPTERVF